MRREPLVAVSDHQRSASIDDDVAVVRNSTVTPGCANLPLALERRGF